MTNDTMKTSLSISECAKKDVLAVMRVIAGLLKMDVDVDKRTYNDQRALINSIFHTTSEKKYNVGNIMLRLTVIDSLYATNAAYSYFSIEEMAQRIHKLGSEKEATRRFANYALGNDDEAVYGLFEEPFGIRKNLADGSKQVSLLSKYAYYCVLQEREKYPLGFPIYDSLAKEIYPKLCTKLGVDIKDTKDDEMKNYVSNLRTICHVLFKNPMDACGMQQFDLLDAYLWRMGKFAHGNLSLMLERQDYVQFIENLKLQVDENWKDKDGRVMCEPLPEYAKRMRDLYNGKPLTGNKKVKIAEEPNTVNVDDLVLCEFVAGEKKPFKGISNQAALEALYNHWKEYYLSKSPKATGDFKKSAVSGDYTIGITADNKVTVSKGGTVCDNVKAALREISAEVGFEYDSNWTTQQLGSKLVDFINNK